MFVQRSKINIITMIDAELNSKAIVVHACLVTMFGPHMDGLSIIACMCIPSC